MADFDLIRYEGDHEKTVIKVRVPDWLWTATGRNATGTHSVEVLSVTQYREVPDSPS